MWCKWVRPPCTIYVQQWPQLQAQKQWNMTMQGGRLSTRSNTRWQIKQWTVGCVSIRPSTRSPFANEKHAMHKTISPTISGLLGSSATTAKLATLSIQRARYPKRGASEWGHHAQNMSISGRSYKHKIRETWQCKQCNMVIRNLVRQVRATLTASEATSIRSCVPLAADPSTNTVKHDNASNVIWWYAICFAMCFDLVHWNTRVMTG